MLMLLLAIGVGVWLVPEKEPPAEAKAESEPQKPAVVYDLEIYHYHEPGKPESEEIATSLDKIGTKYARYVHVNRIDITRQPELAKAEKVTHAPTVVMIAGDVRACQFQGVWTFPKIEHKIEEILRGLKRMSKDWLPQVKGMQRASGPATQTP